MSGLLDDVAVDLAGERQWGGDRTAPITGVLITVVCRTGYVVDTAADWRWLVGWRYSITTVAPSTATSTSSRRTGGPGPWRTGAA